MTYVHRLVFLFAIPLVLFALSCTDVLPMDEGNDPNDPRVDPIGEGAQSLPKGTAGAVNGQGSYCDDPANRCVYGEGDCDIDSQCTGAGIVCGTKNGPRFDFSTSIDVCVPSSCTNGTQDGDETGIDCGGQCGNCLACPLAANGTGNGCSYLCPCAAGGGDCDADYECQTGLICKVGTGSLYGQPAGNDVCVLSHCANGIMDSGEAGVDCGGTCGGVCASSLCPLAGQVNSDPNFCSPTCPCSAKQGDCDANSECATGLNCATGKGAQFNFGTVDMCLVPHCSNSTQDADETGLDCGGADCGLCACSGTIGSSGFCSACYCDGGQGHCTSDAECRPGLRCGTGNGVQFGFSSTTNVCVAASCLDGVQSGAETGMDCGGECGACLGACGTPNTANSCSPTCRCATGGGDCDSSADCQTGLVCDFGNGAKFGYPGHDFCVLPHCTDGVENGDETGLDCGGSCGSVGCVPQAVDCSLPGGGDGTACSPVEGGWVTTLIGTGALNKAFVDKNASLYVGGGSTFYTNRSGSWVSHALNSDKWAIDENGTPHTVSQVSQSMSTTSSGLIHSRLVDSSWVSESVPVNIPSNHLFCPGRATAWNIIAVKPDGSPHIAYHWYSQCEFEIPRYFVGRAYKDNDAWASPLTGGNVHINDLSPFLASAVLSSNGYWYQAYKDGVGGGVPSLVTDDPQGVQGRLYGQGEAVGGNIALAKPGGLPIFSLFSGWFNDLVSTPVSVYHVILTKDVASPAQPQAQTTLLSCTGETANRHALAVTNAGVVYAAWVSTSGLVRFATDASGVWVYSSLGTGENVVLVLSPSGVVNVFVERNGQIYLLTKC